MALAKVVIVGRPNVGKSSLFNALAGRMITIVEPTPGVTRDYVSAVIEHNETYFELVDTGGYGIVDRDDLAELVEQQIADALASATVAVFMVDIREGLTPLDETIGRLLRKRGVQVIGVANKADNAKLFPAAGEFAKLGLGDFLCISVKNNLNKKVLLERVLEKVRTVESDVPPEPVMKLAVVGKRNAGKSTLVNAIVGSARVIVSETPGTTRDAVDVRFEKDGRTMVVIDTPGVRKKARIADSIEFYSHVRARRSVARADVVLFVIDATVPVSQVDKALARLIEQHFKSCVIVVNKWDLAKGTAATGHYAQYLTKVLPGLKFAPIVFTTATTGRNVQGMLDTAASIFKQATTWIPTARLNKAFEAIKAERSGIGRAKQAAPKVYYATQIDVNPVTVLMFVNRPELFDQNRRRFIIARLRELLEVKEVPIRLLARPHRQAASTGKPAPGTTARN